MLTHRQAVLAQLESLLQVVVDDPSALPTEEEGLSIESLSAFNDFLFALPRLASFEQLQRFRRLVARLRASEDGSPSLLAGWDEGACLVAWDHLVDAEDAMDRLASGDLGPREYLVLLRRVPAEHRRDPCWRYGVLMSLLTYLPRPPADYVYGLLDRHDLGEREEDVIRSNFPIR